MSEVIPEATPTETVVTPVVDIEAVRRRHKIAGLKRTIAWAKKRAEKDLKIIEEAETKLKELGVEIS